MKLLSRLARLIRSRRGERRRRDIDLGNMGATSALDATLPALDDALLAEWQRRGEAEPDDHPSHRVTRPARF